MSSFSSPVSSAASSPASSPASSRETTPQPSPQLRRKNSLSSLDSTPALVVKHRGYLAENTNFREDLAKLSPVTSKRAQQLMDALSAYQERRKSNATLAERMRLLVGLQGAIVRFEEKEPENYARCKIVCDKLFDKTLREEERLKDCAGPVDRVRAQVQRWADEWSQIEVTDIPTGRMRGEYTFTDKDVYSLSDRAQASQSMGTTPNKESTPEFWLRLGHLVNMRTEKYGRCLNCAAAVIHTLIMDHHFEGRLIEHVGSVDHDHHFVLIGRPNADGRTSNGLENHAAWSDCAVIDVWDANLPGSGGVHQYVKDAGSCRYTQGKMKLFAAFPANERDQHVRLISDLYDDGNFVPITDIRPEDRGGGMEAVQKFAPGEGMESRKEGTKWVSKGFENVPNTPRDPNFVPERLWKRDKPKE